MTAKPLHEIPMRALNRPTPSVFSSGSGDTWIVISWNVMSRYKYDHYVIQYRPKPAASGAPGASMTAQVQGDQVNYTAQNLTPSFSQQVVQTQITMQDGDTIAVGGLIGENTTSSVNGIPLLSRLPYIGGLFGTKTYSHERTELILFMTPHVIYDTTDLLEASDELIAKVKKLHKYIKDRN